MRDGPLQAAPGPHGHAPIAGSGRDPFVLIEEEGGRTLQFRAPVQRLTARRLDEVGPVLRQLSDAVQAGFHVAGSIGYEAGYAFEPSLAGLVEPDGHPLLRFGVFREPEVFAWPAPTGAGWIEDLRPAWSRDHYGQRFGRVIEHIRAGDTYQVNLTFPLVGRWGGDPLALHAELRRHQPARFGAVVALDEDVVLSFSPELFFETRRDTIRARPMKGTAPRGRDAADDERLAAMLAGSEKNRAENLMIVDLLRNDLSRVSHVGSVTVTDLFTVERYPTVLQMTSGVEARLREGIDLPALFGRLFPCGSVTGAPKIEAMKIIHALEGRARGAYCGSIGYVRPNGDARFSVAIRTATLAPDGGFVFNVGSGVVFDSDAGSEYDECLLKSRFLAPAIRPSA